MNCLTTRRAGALVRGAHPKPNGVVVSCGKLGAALFAVSCLAGGMAQGETAASVGDAIIGGTPTLDFRLRYEHDTQIDKSAAADALTLRSIVGWQTQSFADFSFTAQAIDVARVIDHYDSFKDGMNEPGKGNYPVVVDPSFLGAHQLFVDWQGLDKTNIRLGRQAVTLDDGRLVGVSDLRQHTKAFDGVAVSNTSVADTEIYVAHFRRFSVPPNAVIHGSFDVAHVNYHFAPGASVSAYGYFLDHDASDSSRTLGLRVAGATPLDSPWQLLYTAEYAKQSAYRGGSSLIDAHFTHLRAGVAWATWSLRVDRESFSSNQGLYAFQTPAGNSHQGATDLFGGIPQQGLHDLAVTLEGKQGNLSLSAGYHRIDSAVAFVSGAGTGERIGSEFDLGFGYVFNKQWQAGVDYADFHEGEVRTGGAYPDVHKLWLTVLCEF